MTDTHNAQDPNDPNAQSVFDTPLRSPETITILFNEAVRNERRGFVQSAQHARSRSRSAAVRALGADPTMNGHAFVRALRASAVTPIDINFHSQTGEVEIRGADITRINLKLLASHLIWKE